MKDYCLNHTAIENYLTLYNTIPTFNPFPNKSLFLHVCSTRHLKTLGKGEIARNEQFLLFPQCFQKPCFPGASKGVIVWEWVNSLQRNSDF